MPRDGAIIVGDLPAKWTCGRATATPKKVPPVRCPVRPAMARLAAADRVPARRCWRGVAGAARVPGVPADLSVGAVFRMTEFDLAQWSRCVISIS